MNALAITAYHDYVDVARKVMDRRQPIRRGYQQLESPGFDSYTAELVLRALDQLEMLSAVSIGPPSAASALLLLPPLQPASPGRRSLRIHPLRLRRLSAFLHLLLNAVPEAGSAEQAQLLMQLAALARQGDDLHHQG